MRQNDTSYLSTWVQKPSFNKIGYNLHWQWLKIYTHIYFETNWVRSARETVQRRAHVMIISWPAERPLASQGNRFHSMSELINLREKFVSKIIWIRMPFWKCVPLSESPISSFTLLKYFRKNVIISSRQKLWCDSIVPKKNTEVYIKKTEALSITKPS